MAEDLAKTEQVLNDAMAEVRDLRSERREIARTAALCRSCASFIAEIDSSSGDVAVYLEQRLGPLLRVAYMHDEGLFNQSMIDARKLPPKGVVQDEPDRADDEHEPNETSRGY